MERSPELAALLQRIYDAVSHGDTDTLHTTLLADDGLVFIDSADAPDDVGSLASARHWPP